MAKRKIKPAPSGYVVNDHRRSSGGSGSNVVSGAVSSHRDSFAVVPRNHMHLNPDTQDYEFRPDKTDPLAHMLPRQDDGPAFTQQELMDMVAKRFPRVGGGRFLVVNDFAKRKEGSIIIPDTAQHPSTSGRVCVVGDSTQVKVGDHIVYAIFAGTSLPLAKDARVLAMKDEEIMCWINDDAPDALKLEGEVL